MTCWNEDTIDKIELKREKIKGEFDYSLNFEDRAFGSTKVANNTIVENCSIGIGGVDVLVTLDKKIGVTNTYDVSKDLLSAISLAASMAKDSIPVPWIKKFPKLKKELSINRFRRLVPAEERVDALGELSIKVEKENYRLNGTLESVVYNRHLANSESGERQIYNRGSQVHASFAITNDDNTIETNFGAIGTTIKKLSLGKRVDEALSNMKLQEALPLRELLPGTYDVVLDAPCISHILTYCSWLGLDGGEFHQSHTFTAGHELGSQLFGDNITISDQPYNPDSPYWSIIDEFGNPKHPYTTFIDKGKFDKLWFDYLSALKYNQEPTGHGIDMNYGPGNLVLDGGKGPESLDAAAKELQNGLLIRELNYTCPTNMSQGSFTGITRYGTLLVENGEIVARVPNLRFLESVPHILNETDWLSSEQVISPMPEMSGTDPWPTFIVPKYMQVRNFNVIGSTPIDQMR
ncbi:hypothetical protein GOV11_01345 [Candidatus Woesearchaeota archaeon]|nr:hypothetical protein [Candidatus Woesearchaeota archaeon]